LWHDGFVTIGKGKRPRDTNQLAKFIVDVTTGQAAIPDPYQGKNATSFTKLCASLRQWKLA